MVKDDTNYLTKMGKRRFLETISGLGITGGALAHMSRGALAEVTDDPTEEVPRLSRLEHTNHEAVLANEEQPDREPVYYTISRDKWAQVESANDAAKRINKMVEDITATNLIQTGVVASNNGRNRKVEVIYISLEGRDRRRIRPSLSYEKLVDRIPATINGQAGKGENAVVIENIPVEVQREEQSLDTSHRYYDYRYRPVPAGARFQADGASPCTLGTPANDEEGNDIIVTAGHCLDRLDQDIHQNLEDALDSEIGTVRSIRFDGDHDSGLINAEVDTRLLFASDDGPHTYFGATIAGTVARNEIDDNVGNTNYTVRMRGARTGPTSGHITRSSLEWFETTADRDGGDSGAPHFIESGNFSYIAGIHSRRGQSDSHAIATRMHRIESLDRITV